MARKSKPTTSEVFEAPANEPGQVLFARPSLDVSQDTPQYYSNHAEINFTPHDFCLSFGRFSGRMQPEATESVKQTGLIRVPADVQIVLPTTLLVGLLRALTTQKEQYEKQYGVVLFETGATPHA